MLSMARHQHFRMLRRHVRAGVTGECVGVGDDRPAVFRREFGLPRGHYRAHGLERLHKAALADTPEPVVAGHLIDHAGVAETWRLERQASGCGTFAITLLAMTHRAPRAIDFLAARDEHLVGPRRRGDMRGPILLGDRRMNVWRLFVMRMVIVLVVALLLAAMLMAVAL